MNTTDASALAADTLPHHLSPAPAAPLSGPVTMFTDGTSKPNPGPGGCAALLRNQGVEERCVFGSEPSTTANRMKLKAAIVGLESLERPSRVTVYSTSELVFLGMTSRVAKWRTQGWRTNKGRFVENRDLWERLVAAADGHEITWALTPPKGSERMVFRVAAAADAARKQVEHVFETRRHDGP